MAKEVESTQWIRNHQHQIGQLATEAIGEIVAEAAPHFEWLASYVSDIEKQLSRFEYSRALFTPGKPRAAVQADELTAKAKRIYAFKDCDTPSVAPALLSESVPPSTVKPLRFKPQSQYIPSQLSQQLLLDEKKLQKQKEELLQQQQQQQPQPIRDSSTFGTVRQLRIPTLNIPKMSSDDEDDDHDKSMDTKQSSSLFGGISFNPADILSSTIVKKQPVALMQQPPPPKPEPFLSLASNIVKESVTVVSSQPVSLQQQKQQPQQQPQKHNVSPQKRAFPDEDVFSTKRGDRFGASDPSPLKRARIMESDVSPVVAIAQQSKSKSLDGGLLVSGDIAKKDDMVVDLPVANVVDGKEMVVAVEIVVASGISAGATATSNSGREANPEIKSLKARLGRLNKKLGTGGSGGTSKSTGSDAGASANGLSESMFSEAEESRQKKSLEAAAAQHAWQQQHQEEATIPSSQEERPTTRSFNASLAKISSKLVKANKNSSSTSSYNINEPHNFAPTSDSNTITIKQKSPQPTKQPPPIKTSTFLESSNPQNELRTSTSTTRPSVIDSDGDIDMSIEDYHFAEEIAFDSIDPAKDVGKADILVKNTQKLDDYLYSDDEEEEEEDEHVYVPPVAKKKANSDNSGGGKGKKKEAVVVPVAERKEREQVEVVQDTEMVESEVIPKTPRGDTTLGGGGASKQHQHDGEQGWGAGIMRIGEKLVSNLTAFLPSPSKPVAQTPGLSHIPKPVHKSEVVTLSESISSQKSVSASISLPNTTATTASTVATATTTTATSRLALKKDPGVRAKELAKKRQLEEEKRALIAKEQEAAIRQNLAEKQKKELMEASSKIPPVKPKPVVEEPRNVIVDLSMDEDMELCSQPQYQPQTGVVRAKSKIPAVPTKLPISSNNHADSTMTDFAVPMATIKNLKEPTTDTATPKAFPRHNPSTKANRLQSILKPATPSFDAKLAERVKEGLVKPEPPVVIVHKSGSSGGMIGNAILGGVYDPPAKKSSSSSSSASSSLGGKKSSGPATIVDENGELPDIKDSDDEDDDTSDDDDDDHQNHGTTPAAAKTEPKKPVVPAWVETPNLMKTLAQQVVRDPDEIFGSVRPLSLEDVFKGGRVNRKFRDSMAGNWVGNGELTPEEEEEYKQLMGFK
ncbi:UNVERIFIED_CONTAM: hypothetical protein HDU68_008949 [Siphonaria sp. JEL0065]|nr:hypothetical protein HDU68_008949 [Siphonaria sp. JEL0065]